MRRGVRTVVRRILRRTPGRLRHRVLLTIFDSIGKIPRELVIETGDSTVMVGSPNAARLREFAGLTGSSGRVLFVEPEPENVRVLERAAADYHHAAVDDRGAWTESDTRELLLADESNPADHKVPVEGVEHDNDYRSENYNAAVEIEVEPDYVEIMVNGAEMEVLEGATRVLETASPTLYVKGHARSVDSGDPINERIAAFLEEYGYRAVVGAPSGSTVGDTADWQQRAGDVYAWRD